MSGIFNSVTTQNVSQYFNVIASDKNRKQTMKMAYYLLDPHLDIKLFSSSRTLLYAIPKEKKKRTSYIKRLCKVLSPTNNKLKKICK